MHGVGQDMDIARRASRPIFPSIQMCAISIIHMLPAIDNVLFLCAVGQNYVILRELMSITTHKITQNQRSDSQFGLLECQQH